MSRQIPTRPVGKNYRGRDCNRVTSENLKPGMIVVLANSRHRWEPNAHDLVNRQNQLVTSWWCRVTKITTKHETVRVTAEYSDGSLVDRFYRKHIEWFVRKT